MSVAEDAVRSVSGYPQQYLENIPSIEGQVDILRAHVKGINPDKMIRYSRERYPAIRNPSWVEKPFILIRSGFFSDIPGREVEEMFKVVSKIWPFHNYRAGQFGPEAFRRYEDSLLWEAKIAEQQPGDLWVVGGQFGAFTIRECVNRVRHPVPRMAPQWNFGARDILCMMITHPYRFATGNQVQVHCPGDDMCIAGDEFYRAPCFYYERQKLRFDTRPKAASYSDFGSPTGFVPSVG